MSTDGAKRMKFCAPHDIGRFEPFAAMFQRWERPRRLRSAKADEALLGGVALLSLSQTLISQGRGKQSHD